MDSFSISSRTITATIYDVTGKQIRMIELGYVQAGTYVESSKAIYWDGRTEDSEQVSSGTYFYQIEAEDYTDTRKMVVWSNRNQNETIIDRAVVDCIGGRSLARGEAGSAGGHQRLPKQY